MTDPRAMDTSLTLRTAAARLDELRWREALGAAAGAEEAEDLVGLGPALTRHEALELLALSEVVARKAVLGRQTTVRAARSAGASWEEVALALGTTAAQAEQDHDRWLTSLRTAETRPALRLPRRSWSCASGGPAPCGHGDTRAWSRRRGRV